MPTKKQVFGIENLKIMVGFAFSLTKELVEDFQDGKINFLEQMRLVSAVISGVGVVKAWDKIKEELAELSAAEKKELRNFVVNQYGLSSIVNNKAIDLQIKNSLQFVVSGIDVVEGWKNLNKEQE